MNALRPQPMTLHGNWFEDTMHCALHIEHCMLSSSHKGHPLVGACSLLE